MDHEWFSTEIIPAASFSMNLARTELERFTGLSEREMAIEFSRVRGSVFAGKKAMLLTVRPPAGYDLVDSLPPAEISSRNFDAARLDHILDSNIAVGGT
jgi:hypothetical protein